jgi:hypothetical protein
MMSMTDNSDTRMEKKNVSFNIYMEIRKVQGSKTKKELHRSMR